ncbi:alpha-L-arabinofuranosidase C-terminal domain-containing protein [Nonomuraea sp. SYSU D8015]|uniref:alpha-L-arabinofuranosidase C-terminal domain-containing protein n=1 Tax=Nonomuraea sp. SYSU D8015 TaxID=2593644 RepID=UPI0016609752|nr:alpha-L-arabinofuranosidase C-terminal domain-containing protein [Nonomuraea sp. SYSU D8015]
MTRIALSALLLAGLLVAPPPAAAALADPIPEGAVVDQFDGTTLGEDWTVLSPDASRWSVSDSALHLDTLTGDTHQGSNNARNLFLVDVPDGDFEVVTKLSAPVALDFQSAGLLAWQDWDNYVRAGLAHVGFAGGPVIETATEVGAAFTSTFAARPGSTAEVLKLARTGDEFVSSYWDGSAWVQAAKMTARIDVRQLGLFALSAQNGTSMRADFDYIAIRAAEGGAVVPEGAFTLRAAALPYLSADRSGTVRASARPPMTGLAVTAATSGDGVTLKDVATGKFLEAAERVRLSGTASVFQLKDAGGGKVTVSSGGKNVSISDGKLVMGTNATKFRVEGYLSGKLTVDAKAKGTAVSPNLYGVFYEDINHAADGGLYAELVQNRSFEFNSVDERSYTGLTAWSKAERGATATLTVSGEDPLNANNRNYLRLDVSGDGTAGVSNAGFNRGLPLKAGKRYDLSLWARRAEAGPLTVTVEDGTTVLGKATLQVKSGGWAKYTASFTASATTDAGRLIVQAPAGRTDLDMVSLFPRDTFKGRENGMRADLAKMIADLEPRFLRFPGGCVTNVGTYDPYSEKQDRRRIYQWKETIGPVEERPTNFNFWGYNQSYGIGYYEYFQFSEDIGAEPLPVLSVGVNGCGENRPLTDEAKLARWVQDTLDLIEFANGPVTSEWGKKRAELGHPKPFGLDYIGLGNEEIYPEFFANYPKFADAIRAKYPKIKIISNSGQTSGGAWFDRMWQFARDQKADLVDEHYYNNPDWFLTNNHRYDSYDRNGPKVFVGEYASRGNTFGNALAEASFITGLERNSDVVELASYAPLLANVDYVDWAPDLIWFDNDQAYGSPSYHVQRLFSTNVGDRVVPSSFESEARPVEDIKGAVGLGAWRTQVRYDDVKVTAKDGTVLLSDDFSAGASQWTPGLGTWAVQDGGYVQTAAVEDARSTAGSADWSNYTMEVTARKTGGAEGFLVMFGVRDTGNFYWWNVGGWNNTQSAIEKAVNGGKSSIATSAHSVETGRDYRLKIEVNGRKITTWLDGQKVNEFVDDAQVKPLYQVVSRDGDSMTLKVVNAQDTAVRSTVDLGGLRVRGTAEVTSLTGAPADTNSIAEPERVAPVKWRANGFSSSFTYDFPAHSVTFIEVEER